jgi:hypothetical protein
MSRFAGEQLTDGLLSRLGVDHAIESGDRAIVICTIDEHGWAHPAMVSGFELVAKDAQNVRLALHARSRTVRNVQANGRLTIILADEQSVHYVKGDALVIAPALTARAEFSKINLRVDSVLEDAAADYEQARISCGIRIERAAIDVTTARAWLQELLGD